MKKFIKGGWCAGRRTYITSLVGIISAIAAFFVGDVDLFVTLQTVFTLSSIYFVRKKMDNPGGW
ncbi:MAG: hypothetical protein FWE17_00655 [Alphaproteobacteria bacterium]|nr:hypothetical protein [Alphaproteobacteria bacterium]MCL2758432.1 hypothetical protein [Alphaproteobacteria bacterium]